MGKIYCIMGKSATGKDTIYKRLLTDEKLHLKKIVTYTTRPIRVGEKRIRPVDALFRQRKAVAVRIGIRAHACMQGQ